MKKQIIINLGIFIHIFFCAFNFTFACTSIPDAPGAVALGKVALKENYKCINTAYLEPVAGYGIHAGVDYKAADGTPVYAPISGDVVYSKSSFGTVTIKNSAAGIYVMSLHLKNRQVTVTTGAVIAGVTLIGYASGTDGSGNNTFGPHLHVEVVKIGNGQGTGGIDRMWGRTYDSASADMVASQTIDPGTLIVGLEFHGAGSLIAPTNNCYGCNKDTDSLHANSNSGLVLFQWLHTPNSCDHIDISVDGMTFGKAVEIRNGSWDGRASDKVYSARLPVSIEANNTTDWNVTAVKFDPVSSPLSINATCSVSSKVGTKQTVALSDHDKSGIDLSNGWIWQGNGSLISGVNRVGYGTTKDVVMLTDSKGAGFFQWQKSASCQNLQIAATLPGNYKLRMRNWSSNPDNRLMARDVYLSSNPVDVLNFAEQGSTYNNDYYLLSVYSDINYSSSSYSQIDVSCRPW